MESDERLYERVQRGEEAAFEALHARWERPLFGFLMALLGDRAEAEDALHETFLVVVRGGGRGDEEAAFRGGSFKAWILRVAKNRCLNRLRGRRREARALEVAEAEPTSTAAPPRPDEPLMARERSAALGRAVARLPPTLGEVYRLRAAGLSYDEMAEVLEIPVGTVKSRMNQMVNRLKEEMRPWTANGSSPS